jgi:hypothetical protein
VLARRLGDHPEMGDGRLNSMEQVVLKPLNVLEQLGLLGDGLPMQGRPSISNLFTRVYTIDPLPWEILNIIPTHRRLKEVPRAQ